jgi:hypothetical protein
MEEGLPLATTYSVYHDFKICLMFSFSLVLAMTGKLDFITVSV